MAIFDIFGDGSCIALWEFELNTKDTGENHDLKISTGNEKYSSDSKFGDHSFEFDGNTVLYTNGDFIEPLDEFTISFFIKTTSSNAGLTCYTTKKDRAGYHHHMEFYLRNGIPWFYMYDVAVYKQKRVKADIKVNDDKWHHIAITYKKDDSFKLYVDGEFKSLEQIGTKQVPPTKYFIIGKNYYGSWKGLVDHFRIFNRVLSDNEIKRLLNEPACKILFLKNDNTIWYLKDSVSFERLNKNKNELSVDDFNTYGSNVPLKIDKELLKNIGEKFKVLIMANDVVHENMKVKVSGVFHSQLIIQKQPIILKGYEKVNEIKIDANFENEGKAKYVLSRDGENWYSYDGSNFYIIKSGKLDINNIDDANLVLNKGIDINRTLLWNDIKKFYKKETNNENEDINLDYLYFAFVISKENVNDKVEILNVTINATPRAFWKNVTHKCDIYQGYSSIQVKFNLSGDFKINYID